MCDELAKSHKNINVIHQENGGVSVARNTGIENVLSISDQLNRKNSYIAFLDADDFWLPSVTKLNLSYFSNHDIIGFSSLHSNTKADRYRIYHRYESREISNPQRGIVDWIWGGHLGSNIYQTAFIEKYHLRFIEGCKYSEDEIFIRQAIFCAESIRFFPDYLYVYRRNEASVCHDPKSMSQNMLLLPQYWLSVRKWAYQFPEISLGSKEAWKRSLETYAGGRVLEAIGTMLEYGNDYEYIINSLCDSGLMIYLDRLETNDLSDWQKPDLVMFREDREQFIQKHIRAGKRLQLLRRIMAVFPFFLAVYDKKRFPMKEPVSNPENI